jgi:hypothetical protein
MIFKRLNLRYSILPMCWSLEYENIIYVPGNDVKAQ